MDNGKTTLYINILLQSLRKKKMVLDELIKLSEQQGTVVGGETSSQEEFEKIVDRKSVLLKELDEIDQGFSTIYSRTKEELQESPGAYQTQIVELQSIIAQITDQGIKLEALERRNKLMIERWMSTERMKIKQYKSSRQTSSNYYKTMNKLNVSETYFFDQKK